MKKLQEQANKIVESESSNWSNIYEDFAREWCGKTYQQMWEENNLTRQDVQEWINEGFSNLTIFDCSINQLTSVEFLSFLNSTKLKYLSENLTEFYCGGTELAKELEVYGSPEDGNYIDSGKNYVNLLLEWRRQNELSQLQTQIQVPP